MVSVLFYFPLDAVSAESNVLFRSFGLTLLAVGKGRFPIRLSDFDSEAKSNDEADDSVQNRVIGGPKGNWDNFFY